MNNNNNIATISNKTNVELKESDLKIWLERFIENKKKEIESNCNPYTAEEYVSKTIEADETILLTEEQKEKIINYIEGFINSKYTITEEEIKEFLNSDLKDSDFGGMFISCYNIYVDLNTCGDGVKIWSEISASNNVIQNIGINVFCNSGENCWNMDDFISENEEKYKEDGNEICDEDFWHFWEQEEERITNNIVELIREHYGVLSVID